MDLFLQRDVQGFNRVLQDKLEPLMKVCSLFLRHFHREPVTLTEHLYLRVHPLRAPSQNSLSER